MRSTVRARAVVVGVLLVVAAAAVYAAGRQGTEPGPPPEVQRLGPEPGEPVADYLARAAATMPDPGAGEVWALVQLAAPVDTTAAAGLTGDRVRLSRVVFRVPLPRVQTALVTRELPGQRPAAELAHAQLAAAEERADAGRRAAATPGAERLAAVAAAEADALRSGCACVLAVLVRADRAGLDALADRTEVRAVHAAAPGTPLPAVAVSPLLPEQTEMAGPVPDDGAVPGPGATPGPTR